MIKEHFIFDLLKIDDTRYLHTYRFFLTDTSYTNYITLYPAVSPSHAFRVLRIFTDAICAALISICTINCNTMHLAKCQSAHLSRSEKNQTWDLPFDTRNTLRCI